jgi:hypothetical protein
MAQPAVAAACRFLPTSLVTLSLASRLRARGLLPHSTQLWAVANPNTESDASLAEQKVSAGATVLLTQPPFDVAAWERWLEDARRRGVSSEARIVMGLPMIRCVSVQLEVVVEFEYAVMPGWQTA